MASFLGGGQQDPQFRLYFDLKSGTFAHLHTAEPENDWLPLDRIADTFSYLEWLQSRRPAFTRAQTDQANQLVKALRDYKIPVYMVESAEETMVRDIFTRMNNTGRPLKDADVFSGLNRGLSQGSDLQAINQAVADLGFGELEETWLLKLLAAVDGKLKLLPSQMKPGAELQATSRRVTAALRLALSFLRDEAQVPHWELMPYRFPIQPLVRLFDVNPVPSATAIQHLVQWVWRGAASGQHSDTRNPVVQAALASAGTPSDEGARKLLASVPAQTKPFVMVRHHFWTAGTKLACIGLWRSAPRDLVTGEVLAIKTVIEAANDWPYIVSRRSHAGTENRLLHPRVKGVQGTLLSASPEVLASHRITFEARDALVREDPDAFLDARKGPIEQDVRDLLLRFGVLFEEVEPQVHLPM